MAFLSFISTPLVPCDWEWFEKEMRKQINPLAHQTTGNSEVEKHSPSLHAVHHSTFDEHVTPTSALLHSSYLSAHLCRIGLSLSLEWPHCKAEDTDGFCAVIFSSCMSLGVWIFDDGHQPLQVLQWYPLSPCLCVCVCVCVCVRSFNSIRESDAVTHDALWNKSLASSSDESNYPSFLFLCLLCDLSLLFSAFSYIHAWCTERRWGKMCLFLPLFRVCLINIRPGCYVDLALSREFNYHQERLRKDW